MPTQSLQTSRIQLVDKRCANTPFRGPSHDRRPRAAVTILFFALLGWGSLACTSGSPPVEEDKSQESEPTPVTKTQSPEARRIDLKLERRPERDEAVHVKVSTGILPKGAEIRVRRSDGTLLGTVSPYGVLQGQKAGIHTMALPRDQDPSGRLSLDFELVLDGQAARAPTEQELESVELIFVGIEPPVDD